MRIPLFFALLCVAVVLSGCGSNTPAGPRKHVEIGIIEADLPGSSWEQTDNSTKGSLVVETWKNKDASLIYRVSSNPDELLDSAAVYASGVDDYMNLMNYPLSSRATPGQLRGRQGIRMEAVTPDPNDYHLIEYAIVAGFRQYYIGAGAINSSWKNGGEDNVNSILDSIEIKKAGN